ncbi:MAG: Ser/Thr protein kinase [Deltaproteobacteria bacterium]|nr:MAG: Ser/Thr protein kinase [Deltaproteobacteria bacterium]
MRSSCRVLLITTFLLCLGSGLAMTACAAPKAELWPLWQANDPQSSIHVDHSAWSHFLNKYLVVGKPGTVTLVRYAAVTSEDKESLARYLAALGTITTAKLNRAEQKAFWINLYNALTVYTILDHYPVQSIKDISSGWFSSGPWDMKLVKVAGIELSLNDIEHRILRPIWKDNLVHYAVNCASLGCPNLQIEPFTAENTDRLLGKAAREFINSPRGARLTGSTLLVSSIYDWFEVDFGGTDATLIVHLENFADSDLAAKLKKFRGSFSYDYNWELNKG